MRLFDVIAGGRPEHVAKGALAFLIRSSPGVRRALATAVGVANDEIEHVDTEVASGKLRADIVVRWKSGATTPLEVKLGAPFTVLQQEAKRSLTVIAPSGTRNADGLGRLIAMETLLDAANDATDAEGAAARLLVLQACQAYGWYREELTVETLLAEAKSIFDDTGDERNWPELYRFLVQIDRHLTDAARSHGLHYDAPPRMQPALKSRYYGYYFHLGVDSGRRHYRPWWVGLEYPKGGTARFSFYVDETAPKLDYLVGCSVLKATTVAKFILEHALSEITRQ